MKILLVDDEEAPLIPLRQQIEESELDVELRQVGFYDAESAIDARWPDVVILDIFSGSPADGIDHGADRLDSIWKQCFRPVIVYSASPDSVSEERYRQHPFIRFIKKGSGSELEVEKAIQELNELVELLDAARSRIEDEFSMALRDVAPLAGSDVSRLAKVVERSARRRVAALLDEGNPESGAIQPWEQYVYPPLSQDLRQGDVLHRRRQSHEPEHYRIVLTPSCDLVATTRRLPKVERVLVAQCVDMDSALVAVGAGKSKGKKRRERLIRMFNAGFEQNVVPFPSLSDLIPSMAADLRCLELLGLEDVRSTYEVVASIDSPFRDVIAWAYMRTVGRPGLPERDNGSWADRIVDGRGAGGGS